jgi:hypothetical protein
MKPSDLIERFRPEADEFEVRLDVDTVFRFRAITDYAELTALKNAASKFVRKLMAGKFDKVAGWAEVRPDSAEVATCVYFMHATCVEPKWNHLDWLTLAKEGAWVFETVYSKMQAGQTRKRVEEDVDESERLGEGSSGTSGDETS